MEIHKEIDEAAEGMRDMLKDLMKTMDESASAAGVVTSMVDDLARSLALVSCYFVQTYVRLLNDLLHILRGSFMVMKHK